jgi:hypothetical protein
MTLLLSVGSNTVDAAEPEKQLGASTSTPPGRDSRASRPGKSTPTGTPSARPRLEGIEARKVDTDGDAVFSYRRVLRGTLRSRTNRRTYTATVLALIRKYLVVYSVSLLRAGIGISESLVFYNG